MGAAGAHGQWTGFRRYHTSENGKNTLKARIYVHLQHFFREWVNFPRPEMKKGPRSRAFFISENRYFLALRQPRAVLDWKYSSLSGHSAIFSGALAPLPALQL